MGVRGRRGGPAKPGRGRCRCWTRRAGDGVLAPKDLRGGRARARHNLAHFRANYVLAVLVLVFVGLVYCPVSVLVLLVLFVCGDGELLVCLLLDQLKMKERLN